MQLHPHGNTLPHYHHHPHRIQAIPKTVLVAIVQTQIVNDYLPIRIYIEFLLQWYLQKNVWFQQSENQSVFLVDALAN
jgi:hypothetical protein